MGTEASAAGDAPSDQRPASWSDRKQFWTGVVAGLVTGVVSTLLSAFLLPVVEPRVEEAVRRPTCDDPRDLVLVPPLAVESSHDELEPQGRQSYGVMRMLDGDAATAWVEGVLDTDNPHGRGEQLTFSFDDGTDLRLACVVNGYGSSWDTYRANARLRLVRVSTQQEEDGRLVGLPEGTAETFAVHQELAIPEGPTNFVTLTIEQARGSQGADRATDLAISEIEFWAKD